MTTLTVTVVTVNFAAPREKRAAWDPKPWRLLNVDYTGISCLPESIGSLQNLQILSLNYCDALHNLPSAISQLYSLRCLSLLDTKINQVQKGIGKLKFLTGLQGFSVGRKVRMPVKSPTLFPVCGKKCVRTAKRTDTRPY